MQIPYLLARRGQNKPWTSQPRINWQHPLARGLTFYCYFNGAAKQQDLVSGRWSNNVSGDGYLPGTTALGHGLDNNQGTASASKTAVFWSGGPATFTSNGSGTGDFTLACRYLPHAAPTTAGSSPDTFGQSDSTAGFFAGLGNNNGAGGGSISEIANFTTGASPAASSNVFNTNLTSALSRLGSGANNVTQWLNGLSNSTASDSGPSSITGTTNLVYVNVYTPDGTAQTTSTLQQVLMWAAAWKRALTSAEQLQLHQDPYCFLIFPEDEIFATLKGAASGGTAYTLSGAEGAFVIGGQAAGTAAARHLAGTEGAFVIGGQAATMTHGYKIAGTEGAFVIGGQIASMAVGLPGTEGAFVIGGQAATLTYTTSGHYTLPGAEGAFVIGGQAGALNAARKLAGAEGAFVIGGQASTELRGVKMAGVEGAFVIGGQQVTTAAARKMAAAEGAFVIGGQTSAELRGIGLAGNEGAFVIGGQSSKFPVALSMHGNEGAFVIGGQPASLLYIPVGGLTNFQGCGPELAPPGGPQAPGGGSPQVPAPPRNP